MSVLSRSAILQRSEAVLFSAVDDGTALMDIESGQYFYFDSVGARVWDLIDGNRDVASICAAVGSEFDVSAVQCERDTIGFLQELSELGHVQALS